MTDPTFGLLAARAIEVLVTHNEAVSREDLACALGVSTARVWDIAIKLRDIGYVEMDDRADTVTATPRASDAIDLKGRDELLAALED
jgi:Mn-dependent DtxR family transcriptional regulator